MRNISIITLQPHFNVYFAQGVLKWENLKNPWAKRDAISSGFSLSRRCKIGVKIQSAKEDSFFPVTQNMITRNVDHSNMVSSGVKFRVVRGAWRIQVSYWLKFSGFLTGSDAFSLKSYAS